MRFMVTSLSTSAIDIFPKLGFMEAAVADGLTVECVIMRPDTLATMTGVIIIQRHNCFTSSEPSSASNRLRISGIL